MCQCVWLISWLNCVFAHFFSTLSYVYVCFYVIFKATVLQYKSRELTVINKFQSLCYSLLQCARSSIGKQYTCIKLKYNNIYCIIVMVNLLCNNFMVPFVFFHMSFICHTYTVCCIVKRTIVMGLQTKPN